MTLDGLVPAREDQAPPSELLIDQECKALTGRAGWSGRSRPADTLRGLAACAGGASSPAAGRAAGVEAVPLLRSASKHASRAAQAPRTRGAGRKALRARGSVGLGCRMWQRAANLPSQITDHNSLHHLY